MIPRRWSALAASRNRAGVGERSAFVSTMTGRTPGELAREFGVSAQSVSAWVGRAAADAGKPSRNKEILSSAEREELTRLRRQVRQLQQERDILAKATAWFAAKDGKTSTGSMNS